MSSSAVPGAPLDPASLSSSSVCLSQRPGDSCSQRSANGLRVSASRGNLIRNPYITEQAVSMDVAFSTPRQQEDGSYVQSKPTYTKVVVVGDARQHLPPGLIKGARIEVTGPLETVSSSFRGQSYDRLQIKVFGTQDLKVIPTAPRAAPGPGQDSPPF